MVMKKYEIDNSSTAREPLVSYQATPRKLSALEVILGGKGTLKQPLNSDMDLISLSRSGLPKKTLNSISKKLGITVERLSTLLHISYRTIQRKGPDDVLSVHVSEQIFAIAEVIRRGLEVIGDEDRLEQWLHSELPSLDFRIPLDLLDTIFGTRLLLRILGRIEHGVYS